VSRITLATLGDVTTNSNNPISVRPLSKLFGFWQAFWLLTSFLAFCKLFDYLAKFLDFWLFGKLFGFWQTFWLLPNFLAFGQLLDFWQAFWQAFWLLASVLDFGKFIGLWQSLWVLDSFLASFWVANLLD
jgi:hypothetical protein